MPSDGGLQPPPWLKPSPPAPTTNPKPALFRYRLSLDSISTRFRPRRFGRIFGVKDAAVALCMVTTVIEVPTWHGVALHPCSWS
jgi:hypothetical protein